MIYTYLVIYIYTSRGERGWASHVNNAAEEGRQLHPVYFIPWSLSAFKMQHSHPRWLTSTSVFACGFTCQARVSLASIFHLTSKAPDAGLWWEPPWVTELFLKDWACLQEHRVGIPAEDRFVCAENHCTMRTVERETCERCLSLLLWLSCCQRGSLESC